MLNRLNHPVAGQGLHPSDCRLCGDNKCNFKHDVPRVNVTGLSPLKEIISFERGQSIGRDINRDDHILIVVEGAVAQSAILDDGRRQIINYFTPGDVIFSIGDLTADDYRVETLSQSTLTWVSMQSLTSSPTMAPNAISELQYLIQTQLERSNRNQVSLGFYSSEEKICHFLSEITHRIGAICKGGFRIHLPMNRKDIADYLALNTSTVIKALRDMQKYGMITFVSPKTIIVHHFECIHESPIRRI
ncbi:MAG: hypothetical protein C0605_13540 [Hyphomicrobiales bacterium]|nr:MAG: hypothetical protein C0605_13540 [Hyphomicrobiales bacterium]